MQLRASSRARKRTPKKRLWSRSSHLLRQQREPSTLLRHHGRHSSRRCLRLSNPRRRYSRRSVSTYFAFTYLVPSAFALTPPHRPLHLRHLTYNNSTASLFSLRKYKTENENEPVTSDLDAPTVPAIPAQYKLYPAVKSMSPFGVPAPPPFLKDRPATGCSFSSAHSGPKISPSTASARHILVMTPYSEEDGLPKSPDQMSFEISSSFESTRSPKISISTSPSQHIPLTTPYSEGGSHRKSPQRKTTFSTWSGDSGFECKPSHPPQYDALALPYLGHSLNPNPPSQKSSTSSDHESACLNKERSISQDSLLPLIPKYLLSSKQEVNASLPPSPSQDTFSSRTMKLTPPANSLTTSKPRVKLTEIRPKLEALRTAKPPLQQNSTNWPIRPISPPSQEPEEYRAPSPTLSEESLAAERWLTQGTLTRLSLEDPQPKRPAPKITPWRPAEVPLASPYLDATASVSAETIKGIQAPVSQMGGAPEGTHLRGMRSLRDLFSRGGEETIGHVSRPVAVPQPSPSSGVPPLLATVAFSRPEGPVPPRPGRGEELLELGSGMTRTAFAGGSGRRFVVDGEEKEVFREGMNGRWEVERVGEVRMPRRRGEERGEVRRGMLLRDSVMGTKEFVEDV